MAEHCYPNENDNLLKFICSPDHQGAAIIANEIIAKFPDLAVRDVQCPKDKKYTCWYVSVKGFKKLPILNFTLQANSNFNMEFRYMQFVVANDRDILQWQTNNWVYARHSNRGFNKEQLIKMLYNYIVGAVKAANEGKLRRGGTSAAETIIAQILDELGVTYLHGVRPEYLRNDENNLLELDFLIENINIAIEVQGPHHSKDIFNKPKQLLRRIENDSFKVSRCIELGISLIWMDSEGIQRQLARMPFKDQKKHVQYLLKETATNDPCHLAWVSPHEEYEINPDLDS